jgi:hypothetical protein
MGSRVSGGIMADEVDNEDKVSLGAIVIKYGVGVVVAEGSSLW